MASADAGINERMPFELATAPQWFARLGIPTEPGLSAAELSSIERRFGFTFPPDLRELLSRCLPVGERWPNWRHAPDEVLLERLNWPLEGLEFDLEHNTFWLPEWGPCPAALEERYAVTRAAVAAAPRLIPIYAHRYIPDRPSLAGNPVFSVWQSDIIYYGSYLAEYLQGEFAPFIVSDDTVFEETPAERRIEFWSRLVDHNNERYWQEQAEQAWRNRHGG